ncbi:MAG TPA: ATP-binding protein, partial [Gemmatimonadaceae bacterium]|nr:ATP-binding protein [Gemmatimonadaceae bacterium]
MRAPLHPASPAPDTSAAVAQRTVLEAVEAALADAGPVLVAVSGGGDSIALLDAAARVAPGRVAAANFDHATGAYAAAAARLVAEEAMRRGLPVVLGRAGRPAAGEAAWRAARWMFRRAAAEERGAT